MFCVSVSVSVVTFPILQLGFLSSNFYTSFSTNYISY